MALIPVKRLWEELIYAGYCLTSTPLGSFWAMLSSASLESGRSKIGETVRLLKSYRAYQTHPMDYFYLRLFRAPLWEGGRFANTREMHKFHRKFNDAASARVLRDKLFFRRAMSDFTSGEFTVLGQEGACEWVQSRVGMKVVAKKPLGDSGKSVSVHEVSAVHGRFYVDGRPMAPVLDELRKSGRTLVEDYLLQHSLLSSFHPASLNTVRVISFRLEDGSVQIWAALLRVGCGNSVDNFSAGGLAARVDIETGDVVGPLVYRDPFAPAPSYSHPLSGRRIVGEKLPYWDEVLSLVDRAASANAKVRTVGWDVAILEGGPVILEGNDNWGKTMVQLGSGTPIGDWVRRLLGDA